jgi:hypothetical protein
VRSAARAAAALGAVGLAGVGAAAVRVAILGTVLAGFWPFIVAAGRVLTRPRRRHP